MSWNIQRPEAARGMVASGNQLSMSHEQLLSNRDGETDRYILEDIILVFGDLFFVYELERRITEFWMIYPDSFVLISLFEVLST